MVLACAGVCGSPLQLKAHLLGDIQALGASRLDSVSLIQREVPASRAPAQAVEGLCWGTNLPAQSKEDARHS